MTGSGPHLSFKPLYDVAHRAAERCVRPDDDDLPRHVTTSPLSTTAVGAARREPQKVSPAGRSLNNSG